MNFENPIPHKIKDIIGQKPYTVDKIGMSDSKVITYDDMVLKIEQYNRHTENTLSVMRWLDGKIPVPRVVCHALENGKSYLLMTKIHGRMSCDTYYLERPDELTSLLAQALKMLWSVDVSDCPVSQRLEVELADARYNVEHNLVDVSRCEKDTFGENGFESPKQLLLWLENNKPPCEPVLSHGDFCLPNVFFDDNAVSGFIDLGGTGVADKWRDISLCYRSLRHNFDGTFGGRVYPGFNPDVLFDKLNIEPDWQKLKYYILLDELF